jgi:hypothetical protein
MNDLFQKVKQAALTRRWIALLAMHFCVFSIGLYGSALITLPTNAAEVIVLLWGVLASVFGLVITHHWQRTLR